MNPMMTNWVMPLLGIGIVLFCLFSFILPYGKNFKDKIQRIKGFGIDLEVSVITLFIIIGVIMAFTGIYLNIKDYEGEITKAKAEAGDAKKALELKERFSIDTYIQLTGGEMPDIADLECRYLLHGMDQPVMTEVNRGPAIGSFRVRLKDIQRDTVILWLELEDRATKRRWAKRDIYPLVPTYTLEKIQ